MIVFAGLVGIGLRMGGLLGELLLTMTTTQTITTIMMIIEAATPTMMNNSKGEKNGKPVVGVLPDTESSHHRS